MNLVHVVELKSQGFAHGRRWRREKSGRKGHFTEGVTCRNSSVPPGATCKFICSAKTSVPARFRGRAVRWGPCLQTGHHPGDRHVSSEMTDQGAGSREVWRGAVREASSERKI